MDDHTSTNTIMEKQLGTHTRMETKIGNEKKKNQNKTQTMHLHPQTKQNYIFDKDLVK